MKFNVHYDLSAIVKYGTALVLILALLKITKGFAAFLLPFLVVGPFANRKPTPVLFWVLFMTAALTGNSAVFSTNFFSLMAFRATLVLVSMLVIGKILAGRSATCLTPFLGLMIYILWECVVSVQGFDRVISYLKLILFTMIFFSFYGVANEVNLSSRINVRVLRSSILCVVMLMIVGSIALIPFPGISYMSNEDMIEQMLAGEVTSLFRGMCRHSQGMGPLAGILGTFVFADLVFSIRKWDRLYLFILLCCPIVIYKTSSRTGMGTFLAGIMMVAFLLMHSRGLAQRWKGKVTSIMIFIGIVGVVATLFVPQIRDRITKYALKWGGEEKGQELTMESMLTTRQKQIDTSKRNFKNKPFLGNGFQVSETMQGMQRSGLLSYMSAPIEKGVWVYAVLEEGGVIGFVLFAGWVLYLMVALHKRKAYVTASTFFAMLMSNFGEFGFFSLTYTGGFYWAMVFAATTLDVHRERMLNFSPWARGI